MSSPQGKDKDYQRLKPTYPNVAVTPEKSSSTKLRKRKSEIQMDEFHNLTPLKTAAIVTQELDEKLKGLVGMDVKFLRSNGQEDTGKIKRVYMQGDITVTSVVYTNENEIDSKKELGLDALMPLNMEILKDFMVFTPSSQLIDDVFDDNFFDVPPTPSESMKFDVKIYPPMFEFVEYYSKRKKSVSKNLIIFADDKITMCYKFVYKSRSWFCTRCAALKPSIRVTARIEEENGNQYIKLPKDCHQCQLLSYTDVMDNLSSSMKLDQNKLEVKIHPPMFQFVEYYSLKKVFSKNLIIFADDERTTCYKFREEASRNSWLCTGCQNTNKNTKTTAKIEEENGKQYIKLLTDSHICEPTSFADVMGKLSNKILKKPYYEINENYHGKNSLFVFTEINEEECVYNGFRYYFYKNRDAYICGKHGCDAFARELMKEGEMVLLLLSEHTCEPLKYHDERVHLPYFIKKEHGHIFLFSEESFKMGYEYSCDCKSRYYYVCINYAQTGCPSRLKLMKDGEDEYLKLSINKHTCLQIQYIPDIDKIVFPSIQCPSDDEGIAELVAYKERLQKVHGKIEGLVLAWCYIIIIAGPDTPIEERYSSAAYIGYSTDIKKRLPNHWSQKGVVHELMKKYGVVYLVPIFEGNCVSCYDTEAVGIELRRQGALEFLFLNIREGQWKSEEMKQICKDRDHPEHDATALAFRRLVYDALKKTENYISFTDAQDIDSA